MPKGVEHHRNRHRRRAADVVKESVMPKGVEHRQGALTLIELHDREGICDAERR